MEREKGPSWEGITLQEREEQEKKGGVKRAMGKKNRDVP